LLAVNVISLYHFASYATSPIAYFYHKGSAVANSHQINMTVVKGGVWTNIEDEILKASVSKYGLNQWARVSSLLARKTPKQCKARWYEWLDPGIRKVEWSKEEDEKLLHLAKLMPTQWRTIAPIVGRTATQCLERYQKLLDEAEANDNDDLGLAGVGDEAAAPSADDVRRLRPGELDPDPESKPARPDTIDMDEDEKEMLSEARARLANTQGKKAKRKARERQLEESRRLALLQKRRELKNAGINIKVTTRKKGQMDYNADIPFEKPAASGFYDTRDEEEQNERERSAFDPRKQQLINKRKADAAEAEDGQDRKRKKDDNKGPSAGFQAAMKANQMQKLREAEQSSKRRALNLPAPQVSESELEDIVKMGMTGDRAARMAASGENEATKGLVGNYTSMTSATPIRTPRAPQEEDHIANEIRNARARTETQSALLGGENTPMQDDAGTTGFKGAAPTRQQLATPNPFATPFRQGGGINGVGATPMRGNSVFATPGGPGPLQKSFGGAKGLFASLPKPKQAEWEFELPEEQQEMQSIDVMVEDAGDRDRRLLEQRKAAELAAFKAQSQVIQRALPVPPLQGLKDLDLDLSNPIAIEMARLIENDNALIGKGTKKHTELIDADLLERARAEIISEAYRSSSVVPGLSQYKDDECEEEISVEFELLAKSTVERSESAQKIEKKLKLHLGGYQQRSKILRDKIVEAAAALQKTKIDIGTTRTAAMHEQSAIQRRLEVAREEAMDITKKQREAQDAYRAAKDELDGFSVPNGYH
jgi:pre-mRNA-splicing factor CDC5/CEF1